MRNFISFLLFVICSVPFRGQVFESGYPDGGNITTMFLFEETFTNWISSNHEDGTMSSYTYEFMAGRGDSLSFDWVTSSEEYCDKLVVAIDGAYVLTKSGEDLGSYRCGFDKWGKHECKVIYSKDLFSNAGLDQVSVKNVRLEHWQDSICYHSVESFSLSDGWYEYYNKQNHFEFEIQLREKDFFVYSSGCLSAEEYHLLFTSNYDDWKNERGYYELYIDGNLCDDVKKGYNRLLLPAGIHTIGFRYSNNSNNSSSSAGFWNVGALHDVQPRDFDGYCLQDVKGSIYVYQNTGISNFSYSRTFSNTNWQSFYVPFSMSYDDWKEDFEVAKINNVNMYDTDDDGEADVTELEIIKVKKGALKPNHPYMIKAKKTGDKVIKLADATLYATEENPLDVSSAEMKFTFTGTYSGVSGDEMMDGHYYAMAGGELCYTDNNQASLKPYRWYMKVESRDPQVILPSKMANVRVRVVGEDVEATEIAEVETETESVVAPIYALDGRVVSKDGSKEGLGAGIYIKNGKKFIVK